MDNVNAYRIEATAAQALAEWKALFADQVAENAKKLAALTGTPNTITLRHYQQAASDALQVLATAVEDTDSNDGRQKAA